MGAAVAVGVVVVAASSVLIVVGAISRVVVAASSVVIADGAISSGVGVSSSVVAAALPFPGVTPLMIMPLTRCSKRALA